MSDQGPAQPAGEPLRGSAPRSAGPAPAKDMHLRLDDVGKTFDSVVALDGVRGPR